MKRAFVAIALAGVCSVVTEAGVTRIEIVKTERVEPVPDSPRGMLPKQDRFLNSF